MLVESVPGVCGDDAVPASVPCAVGLRDVVASVAVVPDVVMSIVCGRLGIGVVLCVSLNVSLDVLIDAPLSTDGKSVPWSGVDIEDEGIRPAVVSGDTVEDNKGGLASCVTVTITGARLEVDWMEVSLTITPDWH